MSEAAKFSIVAYLWCVLGIVISVLLPILWQAVYRYFPKPTGPIAALAVPVSLISFWRLATPYLVLGATSMLTAVLIIAFAGDSLTDYRAALLAGYAWDSTLQKLRQ
jgi:hypothetical protein